MVAQSRVARTGPPSSAHHGAERRNDEVGRHDPLLEHGATAARNDGRVREGDVVRHAAIA